MTLIGRVLPILFLATTVFAQDGGWDKRGTRYGAAPDILKISEDSPEKIVDNDIDAASVIPKSSLNSKLLFFFKL